MESNFELNSLILQACSSMATTSNKKKVIFTKESVVVRIGMKIILNRMLDNFEYLYYQPAVYARSIRGN